MKVLIVGNMGSGKSVIAKAIQKESSGLAYHAVDDFRRRFGDGSMGKEQVARTAFLKAIQQPGPMLIECMGLGDLGLEVKKVLDGEAVAVILLIVPLDICLQRLENRKWDVPYPGTCETGVQLCRKSNPQYLAGEIQERFIDVSISGVHVFSHSNGIESQHIQTFILQLLDENETTGSACTN